MNLWLDIADKVKIQKSINNPVDLSILQKHLPQDFIDRLCLYTQNKQLFCLGLSDKKQYYEALTPGDEVILSVSIEENFTYYAQITGKTYNKELVNELWPQQEHSGVVSVYFITNIVNINFNKQDLFKQLGLKRQFMSEAILIPKDTYKTYGKIVDNPKFEIQKSEIERYDFPPTLEHKHLAHHNTKSELPVFPIQAGDIILSLGKSDLSKFLVILQNFFELIRFVVTLQGLKGRFQASFSHASLGMGYGVILEATKDKSDDVRFLTFKELDKKALDFKIYRNTTIDEQTKQQIQQQGNKQAGLPYNRLIKNILRSLYEKVPFSNAKENPYEAFCSELVTKTLRETNSIEIEPSKKSNRITPANLEKYLKNPDNGWEEVTLETKNFLNNSKDLLEKAHSNAISHLSSFNDFTLVQTTKEQIKSWKYNYNLPSNVPLWEQLKIHTNIKNSTFGSLQQEKLYLDFFSKKA